MRGDKINIHYLCTSRSCLCTLNNVCIGLLWTSRGRRRYRPSLTPRVSAFLSSRRGFSIHPALVDFDHRMLHSWSSRGKFQLSAVLYQSTADPPPPPNKHESLTRWHSTINVEVIYVSRVVSHQQHISLEWSCPLISQESEAARWPAYTKPSGNQGGV